MDNLLQHLESEANKLMEKYGQAADGWKARASWCQGGANIYCVTANGGLTGYQGGMCGGEDPKEALDSLEHCLRNNIPAR